MAKKIVIKKAPAAAPVHRLPTPQAAPPARRQAASNLFEIKHTFVGPFPLGRVVHLSELESIPGCDVQRLITIGAIERTGDPIATDPLPIGPENNQGNPASPTMIGDPAAETDPEVEPEVVAEEVPAEEPDYAAMSIEDLRAYAADRGIEDLDSLKKAEVVTALEKQDKENATN